MGTEVCRRPARVGHVMRVCLAELEFPVAWCQDAEPVTSSLFWGIGTHYPVLQHNLWDNICRVKLYLKNLNLFLGYNSQTIHNSFIPYLLTLLSRVLLEKVTGYKLVKEFPAFYETRMFITAFTYARHLSLT